MTKKCSKCGEEKDIEEFGKNNKNVDGRNGCCKKCFNMASKLAYQQRRRAQGFEVIADRPNAPEGFKYCPKCKRVLPLDTFHLANASPDGHSYSCKECWNAHGREFHTVNKDITNARHRAYYRENAETIIAKQQVYQASRKDWVAEKSHNWYVNNKQRVQENARKRAETNPDIRVRRALRARMVHALRDNLKADKTLALLGCDIKFLRDHLESMFLEGMSWDNYGVKNRTWKDTWWTVDHIKPCALFDLSDSEQQRICFHWTNLRPMWWRDNIVKGDKWSEEDQAEWEVYTTSLKKELSTPVGA